MRAFVESLHHPLHHLEAWQYVLDHVELYPDEVNIRPYKRPTSPDIAKGLFTVELRRYGQLTAGAGGVILTSSAGDQEQTSLLTRDAAGFELLRAMLLSEGKRGKLQVFGQGTTAEFGQLLEIYGRYFLAEGYTIHVLGSFTRIVALRITKSRHSWWLCDAENVTGVPYAALVAQIRARTPVASESESWSQGLWHVLMELQRQLMRRFGVALHPTIGQAAATAAAGAIPKQVWLWRPSPLYVGMCRAGGGFRGGYVNAIDYSGPAWKIDVRRQYTAALRGQFPYAVSFGPWHETGQYQDGLFMCTVYGPGKLKVLLNRWSSDKHAFVLEKWNSKECVAILPTVEIEGLTKLGYLVLPGYGFIHNHCFTFGSFVDKLQTLTKLHGSDSLIGQMCKSLGSKVWGKWAQHPTRVELAYAQQRPGKDWSPMTKANGDEIEHLWTHPRTTYNSLQHIELATQVTAIGRAQLYAKAAELLDAGHQLAQMLTDCIIVQGLPPPAPPPDEVRIGQWRYEGWSAMVHTRRTGAYVWDEEPHRPGVKGATVASIVQLGSKEPPPDGEGSEAVTRLRVLR